MGLLPTRSNDLDPTPTGHGKLRVIGTVNAFTKTHLVIKCITDGKLYSVQLSTIMSNDARIADYGQLVDSELIKSLNNDYICRSIDVIQDYIDIPH